MNIHSLHGSSHRSASICAHRGSPSRSLHSLLGAPAAAALAMAVAAVGGHAALAQPDAVAPAVISIDPASGGRAFDGLGGVSAGASTRLLFDYPEPYRSEILDYLFKPNYGAAHQILKVEIGGDMNATDGAEASHMRRRDEQPNYDRGYEWWLMQEARKRNPGIVLMGLEWGVPGWMKSDTPGKNAFWSQDNIDYILKWLDGAKQRGIRIDYVGGWNERGFDVGWYIKFNAALAKAYPDIKIIAADDVPRHAWEVVTAMRKNPKFMDAVDVVGQHSPGTWRSLYQKYPTPPEVQQIGKPIWASEQSSLSHDVGGGSWARGLNRAYIDARITASINWAPVSAWYANLPIADTGLILAEWPWSGYYELGSTVWVFAHTSQFARPGWRYVDTACGYLPNGSSYVTLQAPAATAGSRDFSTIVETMDATAPCTVTFNLGTGFASGPVHVWSSNIGSATLDDDFVEQPAIRVVDGRFTLTLQPKHVYSLTTTTGQHKGEAKPPASAYAQLPLPFSENFDGYKAGKLARYFSDLNGAFEIAPAGGGRSGMVYRQVAPQPPVTWTRSDAAVPPPVATVFGDPRWWGDYELSSDVMLEQEGAVEIIGRVAAQANQSLAGYHLRLGTDGKWQLYSQDLPALRKQDEIIASGEVRFAVGQWANLALRMQGKQLSVIVDGVVLKTLEDSRHLSGNAALSVTTWTYAQFDNVKVTLTRPAPRLVPQAEISVTATSEDPAFRLGDVFPARYVVDGRPESYWSTRTAEGPLPQAITLDLGRVRPVAALLYQPSSQNAVKGVITAYKVHVSRDGTNFTAVAEGAWPVSTSSKVAGWPVQDARYVRLEALQAQQGVATAGELNVSETPVQQ